MPTSSTPILDGYTAKRGLPLSFLTDDIEQELSDDDLSGMCQIVAFPVFKKRIDAHIRKAWAGMTKETFDVKTAVMDALAAFAFEFEESKEAYAERKARAARQAENAVPDPFNQPVFDEAQGQIPD